MPPGQGHPAALIFSMTWRTLGRAYLDNFQSFCGVEAFRKLEKIDWYRGMRRKRASEGIGAPVRAGASDGSIFWTTLGTAGTGFLNVFGSFGSAGASGRVGTIDRDRGNRRKRASGGSGASIR